MRPGLADYRQTMSDIEVVEKIYAAMAGQDYDTLFALVDESVVLTQDERLPWGGRYEGHNGVAEFAGDLTGSITSAVTTEALYEADGEVIQFGRTKGTVVGTGTEFDIAEVHRWTIQDGKAIRAHFAIDVAGMLAALDG